MTEFIKERDMKSFRSLMSYSWILKIFIIFFILAQYGVVLAGEKSANQKSTFKDGRITKTDRTKIHFSRATIGDKSITYIPTDSNEMKSIEKNQVSRIDKKNYYGLKIGTGMAIAGILSGFLVTSSQNTEGVEIDSGTKSGIIIGMGALAGLIGYAFGSNYSDYETVYSNQKLKSTFNIEILPNNHLIDPVKL